MIHTADIVDEDLYRRILGIIFLIDQITRQAQGRFQFAIAIVHAHGLEKSFRQDSSDAVLLAIVHHGIRRGEPGLRFLRRTGMGCEIVIDVTIHRVLRRILCQRLGRHILRRHRMSRQIQVRSVIDEVLDAKKDLLILFQMQSRQIKRDTISNLSSFSH